MQIYDDMYIFTSTEKVQVDLHEPLILYIPIHAIYEYKLH